MPDKLISGPGGTQPDVLKWIAAFSTIREEKQ